MPLDDLLSGYLLQRLAAGDRGRTLLLGLDDGVPRFALAAGLRGASDHPRFLVFARYLIHDRFRCDGYALLLPALLDGAEMYVMERRHAGGTQVFTIDGEGRRRASGLAAGLCGDLDVREAHLPGIMRRELDGLYEALKRPLPDDTG